jgi:hypothetical protein
MAPPDDGTIVVRGYHNCFRIERRLHKVDRWRIPVPYGVPIRGIGYAAAVFLALLILGQLPILGQIINLLSPPVRLGVLPIALGWFLHRWRIDGRTAPAAAVGWVRWHLAPKRLSAFRAVSRPGPVALGDVTVAPDERSARLRPAVVEGPAKVVFRYPTEHQKRGRTLTVRQASEEPRWRGSELKLRAGQRLVIE